MRREGPQRVRGSTKLDRSEKLQKVLARVGIGSRREIERWIEQGRVSINGKRAKLGDRVDSRQTIRVDGRVISGGNKTPGIRVLAYYKPEGEVCTRSDPQGRPTVFDHLPKLADGRWIAVGRLDINTTGLILFTTDGELANRLMHPSHEIEREYAVQVSGKVDREKVHRLRTGVELEDGAARFDSVREAGRKGGTHWYHVTLKEGRRREVRRLWHAVGVKIIRLIRIRYGPTHLPRPLQAGHWEELDRRATAALLAAAGLLRGPRKRESPVQPGPKIYLRVGKPRLIR